MDGETTKRPDLAALQSRLEAAERAYHEAKDAARVASRAETIALNHLNAVQREFDEACAALRKSAPSGSDWTRRDLPRGVAA